MKFTSNIEVLKFSTDLQTCERSSEYLCVKFAYCPFQLTLHTNARRFPVSSTVHNKTHKPGYIRLATCALLTNQFVYKFACEFYYELLNFTTNL